MPDDETPTAASSDDPAPTRAAEAATPVKLEKHHKRSVLKAIVVAQLVVAILTATTVVLGYRHLNGNIDVGLPIDHPEGVVKPAPKDPEVPNTPINILVMGSDTRDGVGNAIDNQTDTGARSDVTLLMHISADRKTAYGVSLPRDAVVDQPACRDANGDMHPAEQNVLFNNAFSTAGPTCTVKMMETLTGVFIDHYVVIDFNGFVDMVDAVHGVPVCIPKEVDDPAHGIHLDAGKREISGQEALNYVRERHVLSPNSDIGRMKRQQAFIAAMIKKVISANTLARFDRVYQFLSAATKSLTTDPGLASVGKIADLALQFRHTGLSDIKFVTVPFEAYPENPLAWLQWTSGADGLWERINSDEILGPYARGAISAADPPNQTTTGSTDQEQQDAATNGLCS